MKVYRITGQRKLEDQEIRILEGLAPSLGMAQQAEAALCRSRLASDIDDMTTHFEMAQMALIWARAVGQIALEAEAYDYMSPKLDEWSFSMHERGLSLARRAGLKEREAVILRHLGMDYYHIGRNETALKCLDESVQIFHSLGDRNQEAQSLCFVGCSICDLGDMARGIACIEQSRQMCRQIGNRFDEMLALFNLAHYYSSLGCLGDLSGPLQEASERFQEIETPFLVILSPFYLGLIQWLQEDAPQALVSMERALEIAREWIPQAKLLPWWETCTLSYQGLFLLELGRTEQAAEAFDQAIDLSRAIDDHISLARSLGGLARLAQAR